MRSRSAIFSTAFLLWNVVYTADTLASLTDTLSPTSATTSSVRPPLPPVSSSAISRRNCSKKITVSTTMALLMYGSMRPTRLLISAILISTPSMLCVIMCDVRGKPLLNLPMDTPNMTFI